jgi:hypothetical protein
MRVRMGNTGDAARTCPASCARLLMAAFDLLDLTATIFGNAWSITPTKAGPQEAL